MLEPTPAVRHGDGTSISIIPTRRTWISLCSSGRLGIVRRKSPSDILVLRMRKTRLLYRNMCIHVVSDKGFEDHGLLKTLG